MNCVGPGDAERKNVIFAEWLLNSKTARNGSFEGADRSANVPILDLHV
jgi:hypothetical protein